MRIVAVSYYDEVFIPVVRDICARTGWSVCDWFVAHPSPDPLVQPESAFPGVTVHRSHPADRGIADGPHDLPEEVELDGDLLRRMAPYESMFMRMLDIYDPDGHSFSGRERRTVYYDFLRAALKVVRKHKPGLYLAGTVPHSLHDYMLYAVCEAHKITTLVYVAFTIPGYLLLHSSLDEGNPRLSAVYRSRLAAHNGGAVPLSANLDAYVQKLRRDYAEGEPWYTKLRDHSMVLSRQRSNAVAAIRRAVRRARGLVSFTIYLLRSPMRHYREHFVRPMTDFFKQQGVPLQKARTTRFQFNRILSAGARRKRDLLRQYRQLEQAPDLGVNYVYVPLQYQPEASTSPMGGAFLDQILLLRLVAAHLPAGWKIYVKEHRTIFDPALRGHFARDRTYYSEILEIAGTVIVPMETSSFDLIDKARAVATVTGTAGWEAVVRGTPSLVFGNAWYRDCEGVFDARTHDGCAKAFDAILRGFRPDHQRVRLFLQCIDEVALYADRDNTYVLTGLTALESRKATVDHFLREYPLMAGRDA